MKGHETNCTVCVSPLSNLKCKISYMPQIIHTCLLINYVMFPVYLQSLFIIMELSLTSGRFRLWPLLLHWAFFRLLDLRVSLLPLWFCLSPESRQSLGSSVSAHSRHTLSLQQVSSTLHTAPLEAEETVTCLYDNKLRNLFKVKLHMNNGRLKPKC